MSGLLNCRRKLLLAAGLLLVAPPAWAQKPAKVPLLGILSASAAPTPEQISRSRILRKLRELGWTEGQNLVSVFGMKEYVEAGGLFSCRADALAVQLQSMAYVDRILRGARPADPPVELVINLKTAWSLGLTIPQSILARADRVIE